MIKEITKQKLIPVTVVDDVEAAEPLAEALLAGGLNVIEITLRTPAAPEVLKRMTDRFPELLVGAGTVLSPYQMEKAIGAGAKFAATPGSNPHVIEKAHALGIHVIPGVVTPSEVEKAMALGCSVLKFFPAEAAGGATFLKALSGPYLHTGVKFLPTGGINHLNMLGYLEIPVVAAVGGSWMVETHLIQEKQWEEITRRTQMAIEVAGSTA